jgi:hypothetical protein
VARTWRTGPCRQPAFRRSSGCKSVIPFASTSIAPNFEVLDIITTVPVDVPAFVVVFGLVFDAAVFDPEEPQAVKASRASGSENNHALRPKLDERR